MRNPAFTISTQKFLGLLPAARNSPRPGVSMGQEDGTGWTGGGVGRRGRLRRTGGRRTGGRRGGLRRAGAQNPRFPVPPGARTRVERSTSSPLRGYARGARRRTRKIPDSQFRRMRRRAEIKTSSSLGVLRAQKPEPPAPFWGHARRNPRLQPRLKHLRAESPASSSKFGLDAGDSARGALRLRRQATSLGGKPHRWVTVTACSFLGHPSAGDSHCVMAGNE